MDILLKEQDEIALKKEDLLKQLEHIKRLEIQNKNNIYDLCKKNTGHKIICEREQGPYGSIFRYCEHCGYEYY